MAAAVLALVVVVGATPAAAQDADDAEPREIDLEPRVAEFEPRVVDLRVRTGSIDGASTTERTPEQTAVTLAADVLFEFDRATLTPAAQAQIATVAEDLAALGPRDLTIDGHTDDVGDEAYNQTLSTQRAESVRAALEATLGGNYTYAVAGHGESQPVAANTNEDGSDNPEGRAANRRVVVTYPTD